MKAVIFLALMGFATSTFSQLPKVSSGRIQRIQHFQSNYVSPRNIDIWLPEGYNTQKRYPVLYMHDGQMLFDHLITWNNQEWGVDETATQLIKSRMLPPFIVVGIWNLPNQRHSEYFPQRPFDALSAADKALVLQEAQKSSRRFFTIPVQSDQYLRFIVKELKPFIDKEFSTKKDRKHTFMAGASMGGLISLYALCEYPKVFGGVACISTHWPGITEFENNPIPRSFFQYIDKHLPAPGKHMLYFDYGTLGIDAWYEPHQKTVDSILTAKGFTSKHWRTSRFVDKDHSENAWRERLDTILMFLMQNIR